MKQSSHSIEGSGGPAGPPAWCRLVSAARTVREAGGEQEDESAPLGFSTRVVARWREVREEERRLALWQRLSWRAAFAAMIVTGAVALSARGGGDGESGPLLQPPSLALPAF
jgi:hypothetical protein